jgi:hypothetical protein
MFVIGEAVIEQDVAEATFCCDVGSCKGACCTLEGGRGAPLLDNEVAEIVEALPEVESLLTPRALEVIGRTGPVEGPVGDATTPCIDERECVYTWFDGDVARCAFERAYLEGRTAWRKPLSCHLFPLRIRRLGRDHLRYEQLRECAPGRLRGEREKILLHTFLQEPLTRTYGEQWYADFRDACSPPSPAPDR